MSDPFHIDEAAQFEIVLDELRGVLIDFTTIGVSAMLVGGQVLAVESKAAGGDGVIEVRTPTSLKSAEEQARFAALNADAAVVGTAIIDRVKAGLDDKGKAKPDLVPGVFAYIRALAEGVRGVRKA